MTARSNSKNGYSKKKLIEIIEKIDTDRYQAQMKDQNGKSNANERHHGSSFKRKLR